jgi:hypothetical protein
MVGPVRLLPRRATPARGCQRRHRLEVAGSGDPNRAGRLRERRRRTAQRLRRRARSAPPRRSGRGGCGDTFGRRERGRRRRVALVERGVDWREGAPRGGNDCPVCGALAGTVDRSCHGRRGRHRGQQGIDGTDVQVGPGVDHGRRRSGGHDGAKSRGVAPKNRAAPVLEPLTRACCARTPSLSHALLELVAGHDRRHARTSALGGGAWWWEGEMVASLLGKPFRGLPNSRSSHGSPTWLVQRTDPHPNMLRAPSMRSWSAMRLRSVLRSLLDPLLIPVPPSPSPSTSSSKMSS